MRQRQFLQLVTDLRAELRRSSDPAVGVSDAPSLKQTLARVYETLYDEHDWPHLRIVADRIALQAGERYYDLPDNLDFDRIEKTAVWWNGRPFTPTRGITFEDYVSYSSEDDERSDPMVKWDVRFVDTREQIEVWPVPLAAGQFLQFQGVRKFTPLVDDDDLCLLDDKMVILFAAVELLPAKSPDVQLKLAAAQARLARVKGRMVGESPTVRMGLGPSAQPNNGRAVVRVSG